MNEDLRQLLKIVDALLETVDLLQQDIGKNPPRVGGALMEAMRNKANAHALRLQARLDGDD